MSKCNHQKTKKGHHQPVSTSNLDFFLVYVIEIWYKTKYNPLMASIAAPKRWPVQWSPIVVRYSLGQFWLARLYMHILGHTHTPIKYISVRNLFHVNLHKIFIINSVPIFGGKNKTFFGERIFKPTHFWQNLFQKLST